ncbi:MAG: hypothetical protein CMG74_04175 [Candidatus Marinimicrobia bacterium]|nr:hypothetical protein [Candidatus Neomarinimicrobiota bacterium]
MIKELILLEKKEAFSKLPLIIKNNDLCYLLSKDYRSYLRLNKIMPDGCKVLNLYSRFNEEIKKMQIPYLDLFSKLSEENNYLHWWQSEIASRNSASIPLQLNIAYLFCAKKIIDDHFNSDNEIRLIFIADSRALIDSISNICSKKNIYIIKPGKRIARTVYLFSLILLYVYRVGRFLYQSFNNRILAFLIFNKLPLNDIKKHKYVIIRSWITKGVLKNDGIYKDRNFGVLPDVLKTKGTKVIILPIFFNIGSISETYLMMKQQDISFLCQYHYLKLIDYFKPIYLGLKQIINPLENVKLGELDLTLIFREIQLQQGFRIDVFSDLCYPLLKRLKDIGYNIDRFYYPFENNKIEKLFILGCKNYFPNSDVIAYQHSMWYENQLGMFLGNNEAVFHPVPDKIICSGPIYTEVLKNAGFPNHKLVSGPSLRFIPKKAKHSRQRLNIKKPNFFLPLAFDIDLAFDLIHKAKIISKYFPNYYFYIRRHPLLDYKALEYFLELIGMRNVEYAENGIIQDWLSNTDMVLSTGGSVTIIETIIEGVPLIRIVPENNIFLDPLAWYDYPLKPVYNTNELIDIVNSVLSMKKGEKNKFQAISNNVSLNYFSEIDNNNINVFYN